MPRDRNEGTARSCRCVLHRRHGRRDERRLADEAPLRSDRGERTWPYSVEAGRRAWQRIERGFGKFERSIQLPHGLDPGTIEAGLANGVLTLWIPKPEPLKPHRVAIKTAGSAPEVEGFAGGSPHDEDAGALGESSDERTEVLAGATA